MLREGVKLCSVLCCTLYFPYLPDSPIEPGIIGYVDFSIGRVRNSGCRVLTEIHNRGVKDILIACVDGLTGFPNAIETVFPKTQVQLCIVYMVRNSVAFVPWQQRKQVCADLKVIYAAATESEAEFNLELFAEKWDKQYPSISKSWRSHWANIIPFFAFPPEIRRAIYTTNATESMNSSLRKVIKSQQIFPSDEAAFKLVYLAVRNISKKWTMPIRDWKPALNRFAILFEDRLHL